MKHHPARRIAATLLVVVAMLSCIPAASAAGLTNLRCEYRDNPLGIDAEKPRLSWVIENSMNVTIPGNTTATVYVPAKDADSVTESGVPTAKADGMKFLRMESAAALYAAGSGVYQFQATLP